ncbi:MAG: hypothetical protein IKO79_05300, partial [Butyrivibrio sp.]|nr:hypothetical protein [Butyrivibrio sp.]
MQETLNEMDTINAANKGSSSISGALGSFTPKYSDEMQAWQDKFCEMAGIYALCLDPEGVPFSKFSGNPHEIEIIRKYVTEQRIKSIHKRVSEGDLEDQAVEITEIPNLRLAAVAVKSGNTTAAVWIVCGVFTDFEYDSEYFHLEPIESFGYRTSESKFYKTLDILRTTLDILIKLEASRSKAVAVSEESRQQELEMTNSFRRAETMTE